VDGASALDMRARPGHDDIVARLRQLDDLDTAELRRSARSLIVENNSLEGYARH
jgi:hypothetical protein